jgi:hypothetical protein
MRTLSQSNFRNKTFSIKKLNKKPQLENNEDL